MSIRRKFFWVPSVTEVQSSAIKQFDWNFDGIGKPDPNNLVRPTVVARLNDGEIFPVDVAQNMTVDQQRTLMNHFHSILGIKNVTFSDQNSSPGFGFGNNAASKSDEFAMQDFVDHSNLQSNSSSSPPISFTTTTTPDVPSAPPQMTPNFSTKHHSISKKKPNYNDIDNINVTNNIANNDFTTNFSSPPSYSTPSAPAPSSINWNDYIPSESSYSSAPKIVAPATTNPIKKK